MISLHTNLCAWLLNANIGQWRDRMNIIALLFSTCVVLRVAWCTLEIFCCATGAARAPDFAWKGAGGKRNVLHTMLLHLWVCVKCVGGVATRSETTGCENNCSSSRIHCNDFKQRNFRLPSICHAKHHRVGKVLAFELCQRSAAPSQPASQQTSQAHVSMWMKWKTYT